MLKLTDSIFLKSARSMVAVWVMLLGTGAVQAQQPPSANFQLLCYEGDRCNTYYAGAAYDIAYGADNGWDVRTGITGIFVCGESRIFNSGDPKRGTRKACFISKYPSQAATVYTAEDSYATVPANTAVWYGVDGQYTKHTRSGQFKCGEKMGDPYNGRPKFCFTPKLW